MSSFKVGAIYKYQGIYPNPYVKQKEQKNHDSEEQKDNSSESEDLMESRQDNNNEENKRQGTLVDIYI